MSKSLLALAALIASVVQPLTSRVLAQNLGPACAVGPIMLVTPSMSWGPESTCRCNGIRGGALGGSNGFAWLWSQGLGTVALEVEWRSYNPPTTFFTIPKTVRGTPWIVQNGGGLAEGVAHIQPGASINWTGQYRAVCYLPR